MVRFEISISSGMLKMLKMLKSSMFVWERRRLPGST